MGFLKKFCNLRANSILESVIALSIISVCLYIAILVYANVFSHNTSARFYFTGNKMDEIYYMLQVREDSVKSQLDPVFEIEEEWHNSGLKKITVRSKDTVSISHRVYFIQAEHE